MLGAFIQGFKVDGRHFSGTSFDWVTPFEQQTGCQANVKYYATSDEGVQLMKTGEYDGVSASGDATLRLIAAGDVAPVNTDLVPNYADIFDGLSVSGGAGTGPGPGFAPWAATARPATATISAIPLAISATTTHGSLGGRSSRRGGA